MAYKDGYDASKPPVKKFGLDGYMYDSCLESHYANTMRLLGMNYKNRSSHAWPMLTIKGQYKPDHVVQMPNGSFAVHEISGYKTAKKRDVTTYMRPMVDDPANIVSKFISASYNKLAVYINGKNYPAAFYKCRECGYADVLPNESPICPMCGHEHEHLNPEARTRYGKVDYDADHGDWVCVDFNGWYNHEFAKEWKPAYEKSQKEFRKEQAQEEEARKQADAICSWLSNMKYEFPSLGLIDQRQDRNITFMADYTFSGEFTPEFYYEEHYLPVQNFGTANDPIVPIVIATKHDEEEEATLDQLQRFVNTRECLIQKAVAIDWIKGGITVCDANTNGKYEPGDLYICHDCGKAFFAPHSSHYCPCCDSGDTALAREKSKAESKPEAAA